MKRNMSCRICGYEEMFDGCGCSFSPLICCEAAKRRAKAQAKKRHK